MTPVQIEEFAYQRKGRARRQGLFLVIDLETGILLDSPFLEDTVGGIQVEQSPGRDRHHQFSGEIDCHAFSFLSTVRR